MSRASRCCSSARRPERRLAPPPKDAWYGQLFFPEELNDAVHAQPPYSQKGRRDTLNERDGIFRSSGGSLLLQPAKSANGYAAQFALALDLSDAAAGRADGRGRGRGRRGGVR